MARLDPDIVLGVLAILHPISVRVLTALGFDLTRENLRTLSHACLDHHVHPAWVLEQIADAERSPSSSADARQPIDWDVMRAVRPQLDAWHPSAWI